MPPKAKVRNAHRPIAEPSFSGMDTATSVAGPSRSSASRDRDRGDITEVRPILAMFSEAANYENEVDGADEWHDSLDMATNDFEESHFLGSSAMQDLTLLTDSPNSSFDSHPFQQVSKDPRTHVFFVKSPAFVYGRGTTLSKTIYDRISVMMGAGWVDKLFDIFLKYTLPAFPILNTMRLLAARRSQRDAGPPPYALLCGIVGHSIEYEPQLKHMFKALWREVVAAEDEEYKQPRLQTLQLTIISLTTRPSQAHAVNAMSLARSISIAHMIGLHLDSQDWRLPLWERSVRKRVWWALIILDKWIAMIHGRPSLMNKINRSVPLPTLDDTDWAQFYSALPDEDHLAEDSMASFVGQCELALVVETMLDQFYSQEGQRKTSDGAAEELRALSAQLDALQARCPHCLTWTPGETSPTEVATGIRCFQLTLLGVRVLVARLYVSSYAEQSTITPAEARCLDIAMQLCESFVVFVEELRPDQDYGTFWLPHCSYLITACLGLLVRLAARSQPQRARSHALLASIASRLHDWSHCATDLIRRLVANLRQAVNIHQWEVAEAAMIQGNDLLRSTASVLPDIAALADDQEHMTMDAMLIADPSPAYGQQYGDPALFMGDWSWALNLGDNNLVGGTEA